MSKEKGPFFNAGRVVLVLALLYFVFLIRSDLSMKASLEDRRNGLKEEISSKTRLRSQLKMEIRDLDDPAYIELLARKKLGLIKRGEEAYKVVK